MIRQITNIILQDIIRPRTRMSANKGRGLSHLLGVVKATKGHTLSTVTIHQIQKLVQSKAPIYHYEVLNLYHYFSINRDENAFNKLDPIFFPTRGSQEIIQPSFRLAYRRLYCLVKYNSPYRLWLPKLKQLLHEAKLNSVDMKFVLNLGSLQYLNNEEQFSQIYDDFISLYMDEYTKVDSLTLIAIRKIFYKNKIKSKHLIEFKNALNKEIQGQLELLTPSQLKFMFQTKKFTPHELFLYLLKFHSIDKKYAFFFYFYTFPCQWSEFIKKKIPKNQVIDIIPARACQMRPINLIEGMISYCTFQRPYIDEFFQFITVDVGDRKQTRLKTPNFHYVPFLINSFYYFFPGVQNSSLEDFRKIKQVLSETKYLMANPNYIFLYVAVRHSLVFHSENTPQEKMRQQIEIVKEAAFMIKNFSIKIDSQVFRNSLFLPTNSLRNVANMSFDVYLIPEFQIILDKITTIYNSIRQSPMSAWVTSEFDQMKEVVTEYTKGKRVVENELFFQQFKKVVVEEDSKYEIWIAKNAEVNKKVLVHYLVKVKNKETNKELKYLLDFTNSSSFEKKKKISMGKFWKHHYLIQWCKLKYEVATLSLLEEYFRSQAFKEHIKPLD